MSRPSARRSRRLRRGVAVATLVAPFILWVSSAPPALAANNCSAQEEWLYFDGRQSTEYGSNGTLQGARADLYFFTYGNPYICDSTKGASPSSEASSWVMVTDSACPAGFFQAGLIAGNNSAIPSTSSSYYFTESASCSTPRPINYFAGFEPGPNTYQCAQVFNSLGKTWYAKVYSGIHCASATGSPVLSSSIADSNLGWTPNQMIFSSEMHVYGGTSATSDQPCGYPTNGCTSANMQYRTLNGSWVNSTHSTLYTPLQCGYVQSYGAGSSSFSVRPNFSGC